MTGSGTYIELRLQIFQTPMEPFQQPLRLDRYCERSGISFFNLQIQCIFCFKQCGLKELADFHERKLSLAWRDGDPYAACGPCLQVTAAFERQKYTQCSGKLKNLDVLVGKPLDKIIVRCQYCFSLLTIQQKVEGTVKDRDVLLIRGYWRAWCGNCNNEG